MTYKEICYIVKELRKHQTEAEKTLWYELRNRKLDGIKFLRQHPIIYDKNENDLFFYVPDFYCSQYKIAIELDGKIHEFQKNKDINRDLILKSLGIKTIRLKNEEIKDIEKIKYKIRKLLLIPKSLLYE